MKPFLLHKHGEETRQRVETLDWRCIRDTLGSDGVATTGPLLSKDECRSLIALYSQPSLFRNRVIMQRHGFGRGEYQYFSYPLPPLIAALRESLYPPLADVANHWQSQLELARRFPPTHAEYIQTCHAKGQTLPTPLLLRYMKGDYNCLHQDRYGDEVFPLQLTILLSEPERDFSGGEFVITEQRPRMQSRAEVIPLRQGEAVIFAVRDRPTLGTRGVYRVNVRHGVSRIRSGMRYTCGVVFHDAA